MKTTRSFLLFAAALALGTAPAAALEVPCAQHSDPRLAAMSDDGIATTSALGLADGRYALPEAAVPTQLVVLFHGHGNDSCSWRNHLRDAAARGAVAFAIDYVRQTPIENYGWNMREAARDSIAAARYFLAAYPSITQVFVLGISMGGNASGLAIASPDAVRADGSPLFDYWVDVEGANNLIEEYTVIRIVAPANGDAALAQQEIEQENGGPLESAPDRYVELTNVARASDMAHLRGAVIVHGIDDGLVTTDQSPQMAAALNAVGVPTHLYSAVLCGEAECGSNATAIAADPIFAQLGQPYPASFAGHGWEGSDTHVVIATGFGQLWALMDGAIVEPGATVIGLNGAPEPGQTAILVAGGATLWMLARRRRTLSCLRN
jgi:acetyl esterase/lipase